MLFRSRAVSTAHTNLTAGVLIGTVAYLSPEQVEGRTADARSDVYSAGICLFEMITGTLPYSGGSPLTVAYRHVNEDVPAPSTIRSNIPGQADAITVAATRRDSNQRYADADTFLSDVRRAKSALPTPEPFIDLSATANTMVVSESASVGAFNDSGATIVGNGGTRSSSPDAQGTSHASRGGASTPGNGALRKAKRRRVRNVILLVFVLLAAVGASGAGWWMAVGPGASTPIPDVVGMSYEEAQQTLSLQGIELRAVAEDHSDTVPAGFVLDTRPAPGGRVQAGGTVQAVVSLGPELRPVPDVRGDSPDSARETILSAGMRVGETVERFDAKVRAGRVAATDPAIGTDVAPGTSINVVVSKGPETVKLPNVSGKKESPATKRLESAGLRVRTDKAFSESVAQGRVISTSPSAGTIVETGSTVTVVISKGPPPVEVPNLIDMRRKAAIAMLESLGLKVTVEEASTLRLNRVFDQSPSPGELVPRGSTVIIRIV